ncbi:hypothetical protein [Bifidobacterium saguinibicoloris]|uniref:hypothetical protein n=1 Tax=Bifidobacterium saguinibicoloris TaxID=2834433 RepID=UPI001C58CBC7|nr:hypothetical protein [Bifidobacterium saguinibicoloris]MBW3081196.1 hypothetical protein [Bifidobacterium saguinibicoloris]
MAESNIEPHTTPDKRDRSRTDGRVSSLLNAGQDTDWDIPELTFPRLGDTHAPTSGASDGTASSHGAVAGAGAGTAPVPTPPTDAGSQTMVLPLFTDAAEARADEAAGTRVIPPIIGSSDHISAAAGSTGRDSVEDELADVADLTEEETLALGPGVGGGPAAGPAKAGAASDAPTVVGMAGTGGSASDGTDAKEPSHRTDDGREPRTTSKGRTRAIGRKPIIIGVAAALAVAAIAAGTALVVRHQNQVTFDNALTSCREAAQSARKADATLKAALDKADKDGTLATSDVADAKTLSDLKTTVAQARRAGAPQSCGADLSLNELNARVTRNGTLTDTLNAQAAAVDKAVKAVTDSRDAKTKADTEAARSELATAVTDAQTLLDESAGQVDDSTRQTLQKAIDAANALTGGTGASLEDLKGAIESLSTASGAVRESMDAYTSSLSSRGTGSNGSGSSSSSTGRRSGSYGTYRRGTGSTGGTAGSGQNGQNSQNGQHGQNGGQTAQPSTPSTGNGQNGQGNQGNQGSQTQQPGQGGQNTQPGAGTGNQSE